MDRRASSPGEQKAEQPKTARRGRAVQEGNMQSTGGAAAGRSARRAAAPVRNTAAQQQGSSFGGAGWRGPGCQSRGARRKGCIPLYQARSGRRAGLGGCWTGAAGSSGRVLGSALPPLSSAACRSVLVAGAVAHLCDGQRLRALDGQSQDAAPHRATQGREAGAGAGRRQAPPLAGAPRWVLPGGRRVGRGLFRAPAPARGPQWLAW